MFGRRLDAAGVFVDGLVGDIVGDPGRRYHRPLDEVRSSGASGPGGLSGVRCPALPARPTGGGGPRTGAAATVVPRRWLDDPNHLLGGSSPREVAARGGYASEIEALLHGLVTSTEAPTGVMIIAPARTEVAGLRAELSAAVAGRPRRLCRDYR